MTRRRARRAAAFLLAPLVALLAVELGMRAADAAACAARPPAPDAFDLYAVGESTADGEPYNRDGLSLAALVSRRFGGTLAGRPVRLVRLARGGQSAYPQSVALEEALRCRDPRRPGAALIYTGHNDAGTARGESPLMRWRRLLPPSRVVEAAAYALERRVPALRVRTLDAWEHHLRSMLRACRAAGVTPVLAVPASNLAGADPGVPQGLDAGALARLRAADAAERSGDCAAVARARLDEAPATRDFLLGRCALRAGRREEAARLLRAAVDAAAPDNFGRATSEQAAMIRALAGEEAAPLVEAGRALGEPGPALFLDGHHPSFGGYRRLADAYAEALGLALGETPRPAGDEERELAAFACGASCRAAALAHSGWWWLSVASGHPMPERRLDAALALFDRALALSPEDSSAALGAALAAAAARGRLLDDPAALAELGEMGLFYGRGAPLDAAGRSRAREFLRARGTPPARLAALDRAWRAAGP